MAGITQFRVNGLEPPVEAMPTADMSPTIIRPDPETVYSDGKPARAVGMPYVECGRPWINQDGINWWMQFFSSPNDPYVDVTAVLYDPLQAQWVTVNAHMWRPTYSNRARGGYKFSNFLVKFTGFEV